MPSSNSARTPSFANRQKRDVCVVRVCRSDSSTSKCWWYDIVGHSADPVLAVTCQCRKSLLTSDQSFRTISLQLDNVPIANSCRVHCHQGPVLGSREQLLPSALSYDSQLLLLLLLYKKDATHVQQNQKKNVNGERGGRIGQLIRLRWCHRFVLDRLCDERTLLTGVSRCGAWL